MSIHLFLRPVSRRAIDAARGDERLVEALQLDATEPSEAPARPDGHYVRGPGGAPVWVEGAESRARRLHSLLRDAGLDERDFGTTHAIGATWDWLALCAISRRLGFDALNPFEDGGDALTDDEEEGRARALSPEAVGQLARALHSFDRSRVEQAARQALTENVAGRPPLRAPSGETEDDAVQFIVQLLARVRAAADEATARELGLLGWTL